VCAQTKIWSLPTDLDVVDPLRLPEHKIGVRVRADLIALRATPKPVDVQLALEARHFVVREKPRQHVRGEGLLIHDAERLPFRKPSSNLGRDLQQQIVKFVGERFLIRIGQLGMVVHGGRS